MVMKHVRKVASMSLAVVLAMALPAAARAQSQATTAEINGRVIDAQGGFYPA